LVFEIKFIIANFKETIRKSDNKKIKLIDSKNIEELK